MKRKTRRIEKKSSRTAGFNCMYRAASYLAVNEYYKSDDSIAPKLLPFFVKFLVTFKLINFTWPVFPIGIYEYVIARTKYIDTQFKGAIDSGFDQILIFGAGFDSRAVRFHKLNRKTKIFELDSPHTQKVKVLHFKKREISLPDNVVYIPIDFNKEMVLEKLLSHGFDPDKRTFFLMEGLIMYLTTEAVDELFTILCRLASSGSRILFDYIYASVLRQENTCFGEKSIYKTVNGVNESWLFGIEKGETELFLKKNNFKLIRNLDSGDLENIFFKKPDGTIVGKVNGTHCIAYAEK